MGIGTIKEKSCHKLKSIGVSTEWDDDKGICKVDMPNGNPLMGEDSFVGDVGGLPKNIVSLNSAIYHNDAEDLKNLKELREFLDIWNYSNEWGYEGDNMEEDVESIKSFVNKQLKDYKE